MSVAFQSLEASPYAPETPQREESEDDCPDVLTLRERPDARAYEQCEHSDESGPSGPRERCDAVFGVDEVLVWHAGEAIGPRSKSKKYPSAAIRAVMPDPDVRLSESTILNAIWWGQVGGHRIGEPGVFKAVDVPLDI